MGKAKRYNLRRNGTNVSVIEANPNDGYKFAVSVGDIYKNQPLIEIRHAWMENQGYHRIGGINLNFFNMKSIKPMLVGVDYRDSGFTFKAPKDTSFQAVEAIFKNNKLIVEDVDQATFEREIEGKANWAVSLSYSLVIDGKKDIRFDEHFAHAKYNHPRSLVGQKADGTMVLVVVDGRSSKNAGMTANESADLMLELGCVTAVNADGGGSSQLIYNDMIINDYPYPSCRKIAGALLIYHEDELENEVRAEDMPTLYPWTRGDEVAFLQSKLINKGYNLGRTGADGVYGPLTQQAVKDFQKDNGLKIDGITGPNTWGELLQGKK